MHSSPCIASTPSKTWGFAFLVLLLSLLTTHSTAQGLAESYQVRPTQARTTNFNPDLVRYYQPLANGLDTLFQDLNTWNNGLLQQEVRETYTNGAFSPQSRHFYTYDAQGRETRDSTQFWQNNAWVNSGLLTNTYDANGTNTASINHSWNGSGWDTLTGTRQDITYNSNNLVEESIVLLWQGSNGFIPNSRTQNYYNTAGTEIDSFEVFSWNGMSWNLLARFQEVTWFNFSQSLFGGYVLVNFLNGTPAAQQRHNFLYSDELNFQRFVESWNGMGYDSLRRSVQQADASDNITLVENFSYNNGMPSLSSGSRFQHTYDGTNTLESTMVQEFSGFIYENIQFIEYLFTGVGRPEPDQLSLDASLYPNPSQGSISLQLQADRAGQINIKLMDLHGKTIFHDTERVNQGLNTLAWDLPELPAGLYLFQAEQAGQRFQEKLLIR